MKRFTAVPTFLVALVACQEPTKSVTADSETSTPLSVRTTAGTFTISLRSTSGATGPSLAVFGSGGDTPCNGTMPAGTYMGNVVVNANTACNLSGATVTGNLIARQNSTLIADHNDIRGNVELLQTDLVSMSVNVIGGTILGEKPKRGLDIYKNQIGGSIFAKEGTAFIGLCGNTLKNGPIVVEKNRSSSILAGGDGCVEFGGGNVLGNVDIKVDDNEVVVVSGVPSNGLQIGDNQIGQHLQVFKNRGGLPKAVTRNTVRGSLQCFENTAPFVGEPNVAQEAEGNCKASPPAPVPVASVTVAPSTATVEPGKTVQLAATMRDASGTVLTGRTVTWASSNTAVATVSSGGLVSGVAPSAQPATITATSEGKTGTAQITVPPVASVTVAPSTATVEKGKTVQLTATTRDANGNVLTGRTVTWKSLNTAVAMVSSGGLVTGVAAGGPVSIEAASEGQTGTAQITVTAPPPPPPVTNSPTCAQYAEPRIWLESQGWWDSRGLVIPSRVGEHIHVGTCWPVTPDGGDATMSGTIHFDVRVVLHDHTGKTDILRVAQESVIRQIVPLVMGPAADETRWVSFDVNTDGWDTGRREWRWTANVPRNSEGNRHFQSTGWQLCVRACTPNETYRAGPWTEGRGWYDDGHGYQNARFLSKLPYAPLSGLWTFRVRLVQSGVGGVFIDPDFHAGNQGIKIASGGYDGNLTIDTRTLSNGVHRLVLVASDNQSAGVQVIEFRVAN